MPSSAVLVPLYVYPFPGAWTPLYDAIEANPDTQFLVIINPGNGPGPAPLPDANYCREIPKLGSHSNVAVYGYVYVNWARRDLDQVRKDVEIYGAWPEQQQHDTLQSPHQTQHVSDIRLAIDGIFVDETPILAHEHEVAFLGNLTSLVHSIWPSLPAAVTSGTPVSDSDSAARIPTIIHNPGCMPPPALRGLADLCVVFEDTHATFLNRLNEGVFALPSDDDANELTDPTAAAGSGGGDDEGEATGKQHHTLTQLASGRNGSATVAAAVVEGCEDSLNHGHGPGPRSGPGPQHSACSAAAAAAATEREGVQQEKNIAPAKNNPWAAVTAGGARKSSAGEKERLRRAVVVHSITLPERKISLTSLDQIVHLAQPQPQTQTRGLGEGVGDHDQQALEGQEQEHEQEKDEEDTHRAAHVLDLVTQAKQVAGALFVTELSSGFYEGFSRGWREWAGVIGAAE